MRACCLRPTRRHGLDVQAVGQAATEVAAVLEGDLPSSIELLDIG
jgi:hypothetical protein